MFCCRVIPETIDERFPLFIKCNLIILHQFFFFSKCTHVQQDFLFSIVIQTKTKNQSHKQYKGIY